MGIDEYARGIFIGIIVILYHTKNGMYIFCR